MAQMINLCEAHSFSTSMVYLAEYSIRTVLWEKVYRSKIANVDELKTRLIDEYSAVFTVRRYALHGICDRNSVCPSVRPSVCHTRGLCPHGSTYDHDFVTIW